MNPPLETGEIRLRGLDRGYSASVQRGGRWWIGWIDDVPGVNSPESRKELVENLGSALQEALEMQ